MHYAETGQQRVINMWKFILKGMMRDASHSLFPIITITIGVCITVIMSCWIDGVFGDLVQNTSKLQTGHLEVTTREYANEVTSFPLEYSLINSDEITENLRQMYPEYHWVQRIDFGGIIDVPDKNNETKEQGFFYGKALDLISKDTPEIENLNLKNALKSGRLPKEKYEILLSRGLFEKLNISLDSSVTLISNTMDGSMSMFNFTVVGTILFGIEAMDRQAVICDIEGARDLLYMKNTAAEILGISDFYNEKKTEEIKKNYNDLYSDENYAFSPIMLTLRDHAGLGIYLDMVNQYISTFLFIFIFIMSIVLWNSGLMKGIRRYGEFGIRLALGESKGHLYRTMIMESIIVGFIGTIIGTITGLLFAYYAQEIGISLGEMAKNSSIMLSNTIYAKITPKAFYIGFIPGLLASVAGALLSGRAIFKRETSQLFKELEK